LALQFLDFFLFLSLSESSLENLYDPFKVDVQEIALFEQNSGDAVQKGSGLFDRNFWELGANFDYGLLQIGIFDEIFVDSGLEHRGVK